MSGTTVSAQIFRLNAGSLCLDFANNVMAANVRSYADLLAWSEAAGVLSGSEAYRLMMTQVEHAREAARVVKRARALGVALYGLFSSAVGRRPVDASHIDCLNKELAGALPRSRIIPTSEGFSWAWGGQQELESVLWPVAVSASQILTDGLEFVRECAGRDCHWLFVDMSKNHSRHWCDMRLCGNREKARRHYRRTKELAG